MVESRFLLLWRGSLRVLRNRHIKYSHYTSIIGLLARAAVKLLIIILIGNYLPALQVTQTLFSCLIYPIWCSIGCGSSNRRSGWKCCSDCRKISYRAHIFLFFFCLRKSLFPVFSKKTVDSEIELVLTLWCILHVILISQWSIFKSPHSLTSFTAFSIHWLTCRALPSLFMRLSLRFIACKIKFQFI